MQDKTRDMYAALDKKVQERTKDFEIGEEKYLGILNNLQEGVQIISNDWRYLFVNDSVTKQTRYSREELIGYTLMEKYPGIEKSAMFKTLEKCMEQRVTRRFENEHTYPDHSKGYFDLMVQPVPDGVLILSIDISDRKKDEEEIRKLNATLENKIFERTSALENAYQEISDYKFALDISSIVSITDQNGIIQYANTNFCKISGYSSDELIGNDHSILNSGIHPKGFMADLWATVKSGNIWKGEIQNKAKDSSLYWLHVTIIPFLDEKGHPYKYMSLQKDITGRKKIEEKIVQDSIELEGLNKELNSFTYSVSHDLRAPLRAIGGYAQILEEECGVILSNEGKRLLDVIRQNALKMGKLIDDLLNFSRLGRKEIQKISVDMVKLTQDALEELKSSMDHQPIITVQSLSPAFADSVLMGQVMANLLSNAIKYSSKKVKPVVEVKSEDMKGETVYSVTDNGVGFDMQYAHKLFGVFQRLHSDAEFAGTGVGLAIVQRIINKHGGRVWAEAEPEKGATFYFTLPHEN